MQNRTHAVAAEMVQRMWRLLGEKTKWRDDVPGWTSILLERWEESGMSREDFEKIVVWAATENEYTAVNLRLARNPAKSLFVNQWENVLLFYDAAMAGKKARERRWWKHGACVNCDERQARQSGWCKECEVLEIRVSTLLKLVYEHRMVYTYDNNANWLIRSDNLKRNPDARVVANGKVTEGFTGKPDVQHSIYDALMKDPDSVGTLEYALKMLGVQKPEPRGFDIEEA
jgi:hypothetical protein